MLRFSLHNHPVSFVFRSIAKKEVIAISLDQLSRSSHFKTKKLMRIPSILCDKNTTNGTYKKMPIFFRRRFYQSTKKCQERKKRQKWVFMTCWVMKPNMVITSYSSDSHTEHFTVTWELVWTTIATKTKTKKRQMEHTSNQLKKKRTEN